MKKTKIAVIGVGPVGSILTAHLINAGYEIYVVDVLPHLIKALEENGIRIEKNT